MNFSMPLLRQRVRRPLGIGGILGADTNKYDDDTIDEYLNYSYRDLLQKYAFREKEVVATVATTIGRRSYPMPNPHDGLRMIDILDPKSSKHLPLEKTSILDGTSQWDEKTAARGFPTHYFRESCVYRLIPVPDAVYTLTVRYWGVLTDLTDLNTSIEIPQIWEEPIIYGAVYRASIDLNNMAVAQAALQMQGKMIAEIPTIEAKEESDYHLAGVEVLGREY